MTAKISPYKRVAKRAPKAKPGELRVGWGGIDREPPELVFAWGADGASKRDSNLLMWAFCSMKIDNGPLVEELKLRGYDITTFDFRIRKVGTK